MIYESADRVSTYSAACCFEFIPIADKCILCRCVEVLPADTFTSILSANITTSSTELKSHAGRQSNLFFCLLSTILNLITSNYCEVV